MTLPRPIITAAVSVPALSTAPKLSQRSLCGSRIFLRNHRPGVLNIGIRAHIGDSSRTAAVLPCQTAPFCTASIPLTTGRPLIRPARLPSHSPCSSLPIVPGVVERTEAASCSVQRSATCTTFATSAIGVALPPAPPAHTTGTGAGTSAFMATPTASSATARAEGAVSPMTPPPPSHFKPQIAGPSQRRALQSSSAFSFASSISCPSPSSSSSITAQISSQRTAQIARHLSSSAKPQTSPAMSSSYSVRKVGAPNTLEHRVYIEKDGQPVSSFHDIPLYANQEQTILNMIVEIPRWTNGKLEISKEELLNPIKQDIKKGKLRFVRNCFPHKGYLWNYGAFPQTWEDPNTVHPETKAKGDNDPLDVCEIGELVGYTGQIKQVKVLGVMALLDEEETDWKVIVIDVNDPLAPKLNDVEDVERHLPGLLRATNEWFRIYKIPDGKPENQFAFTGECKNKAYAMDVIHECAEAWERLITGKTQPGGLSIANTTVHHSPAKADPSALPPLPPHQELPPEKIDSSIDKWFFISGASA